VNLSSNQIKIISIAAAFFVLAFVYIGHFTNGFFFDDVFLIQQNPAIRSLSNIPGFFTNVHDLASRNDYQIHYRPLFLMSFAIDYYIGHGLSPLVMHIHTFIGFLITLVLCFLLSKNVFKFISDKPFYPALFATCCFAFHPAVADVINYIDSRDDSFAMLFGMLYMLLYINVPVSRKCHLYLIPLVIGCLFKISAIVAVPLLWLYIMFFKYDLNFGNTVEAIKKTYKEMAAGIIAMLVMLAIVTLKSAPAEIGKGVGHISYLLTQAHVILNYFVLFFDPENLNPNAWRDFITSPFDWHFIVGAVFILGLLAAIYILSLKKSTKPISFGLAWFLICLLPSSSIFPIYIAQVDYRMFASVFGLVIAIITAGTLAIKYLQNTVKLIKPIMLSVLLLFMGSLVFGSRERVNVWSSDMLMWQDVIKKDPTNGRVLMNLGVFKMQAGKVEEAEEYFEKAKVYAPNYDLVYVNLGIIKQMRGDTATAHQDFEYAVRLNGFDHAECCFYLARYLHQYHHNADATPLLKMALTENSGLTDVRHLLMDIYAEDHNKELGTICRQTLGLFPDDTYAANYYKQFVADSSQYVQGGTAADNIEKFYLSHPSAANYINLSLSYFGKGEYMKVVDACKKAIELDPKSAIAYNNMCAAYNNLKMWDEAIDAGKMALKIDPSMTLAQNNLNFALQQKRK
jgi:Tfp pilus assembly protein PilF